MPDGTDANWLQSVKQGQPPSADTAALSDGFEDISLDDGGARAANDAKAGGAPETAGDSVLPPKAARRVVLFSGASCEMDLSSKHHHN